MGADAVGHSVRCRQHLARRDERGRAYVIALAPAAFEERSMQEDTFLIGSIMKEIVESVFRQSKRK